MPRFSPEVVEGNRRAAEKLNHLNKLSSSNLRYSDNLQPGWIRLVDIQPGSETEPLICSLSHFPMEVGPDHFEAVSYVWGDADHSYKITCNYWLPLIKDDQFLQLYNNDVRDNFSVTKNLHQLLLHLRRKDAPRRLWIDHICINQTNL